MPTQIQGQITELLARVDAGDSAARDELVVAAYDELRAQAARLMRAERAEHTLQPTALVHEAALRLLDDSGLGRARTRGYFYWAMARAMRQVLVDHARARRAQRRGGDVQKLPLDITLAQVESALDVDLLALDEALQKLAALDPRKHDTVVLRFFGGLELTEIAKQQGVSLSTVNKDWAFARAWLRDQLREPGSP